MDLMCLCFVSIRAIIFGLLCVLRISCKSKMVVCIPLVLRVRTVIAGWEYAWVDGGVLGCVGFCCIGGSRWVCVSLWCVSDGLGYGRLGLGLYGVGVGIALVGIEVGGERRVGFHALHSRMLSCVEVAGFLVCLVWGCLFFLGPRVWAGGLSVAMCLILVGVVGVSGVWVGCCRVLRRLGGVCMCMWGEGRW